MEKYFNFIKTEVYINSYSETIEQLSLSKKILLVTTSGSWKRGIINKIIEIFTEEDIIILDSVQPNPELDLLNIWISQFKNKSIKTIIALGGGSAIDAAKVLSIGLSDRNHHNLNDFLFKKESINSFYNIPVIAIPTTSGSGAEVTPFATVWDEKLNRKYSLGSELIRPKYAILDHLLTINLPLEITIYSGLDAISHCFESIWNLNASSKSIEVASTALYTLLNSFPKLLENPSDNNLRKLMQVNSCLAGIAISFTKTALAHSISYPLTTNYNIPHGLACSFTLPEILLFNSKKDDGRLLKLSNHLGYKDINYLYKELKNLFLKIDLNKRIKKKLPHDLSEVFKISNQMFNPERVSNNLRVVELDDIQNILFKSL